MNIVSYLIIALFASRFLYRSSKLLYGFMYLKFENGEPCEDLHNIRNVSDTLKILHPFPIFIELAAGVMLFLLSINCWWAPIIPSVIFVIILVANNIRERTKEKKELKDTLQN